jgi:hypothetical protein
VEVAAVAALGAILLMDDGSDPGVRITVGPLPLPNPEGTS